MKPFLPLLATAITTHAGTIADGSGFFPVIVTVLQADGITPAAGVSVKLADLPAYHETELDPAKRMKAIPDSLGKPVQTDARGCAVVFYHGKWSSFSAEGKSTYTQPIHGTLVITRQEQEIFRQPLKDWAMKNRYTPRGSDAPWITVLLGAK